MLTLTQFKQSILENTLGFSLTSIESNLSLIKDDVSIPFSELRTSSLMELSDKYNLALAAPQSKSDALIQITRLAQKESLKETSKEATGDLLIDTDKALDKREVETDLNNNATTATTKDSNPKIEHWSSTEIFQPSSNHLTPTAYNSELSDFIVNHVNMNKSISENHALFIFDLYTESSYTYASTYIDKGKPFSAQDYLVNIRNILKDDYNDPEDTDTLILSIVDDTFFITPIYGKASLDLVKQYPDQVVLPEEILHTIITIYKRLLLTEHLQDVNDAIITTVNPTDLEKINLLDLKKQM